MPTCNFCDRFVNTAISDPVCFECEAKRRIVTNETIVSTHNPTPWRIDAGHHGIHIINGKRPAPFNGDLVASVYSRANADLIVRAVNHHADLVQALRDMVGAYHGDRDMSAEECVDAAARARAILAKLDAQS